MNRFFYFLIACLLISWISGCQKSTDVTAPDPVSKLSANTIKLSVPETICSEKEFSFSVQYANTNKGKLQVRLSSDDGKSWYTAAENSNNQKNTEEFYLTLSEGKYKIQVCFIPSDKREEVIKSEIIERNVFNYAECDGLVLEPNLEGGNYIVHSGQRSRFTAEFTILACDKDYKDLTLTGRLNDKSINVSSSPEIVSSLNKSERNYISWKIGDVNAGFQKTFRISFDLDIPEGSYGTLIPLTGGFVLGGKNPDGSDVVIGDYNEIFIQIQ